VEVIVVATLNKLPFTYDKNSSFFDSLGDWIGDVFYDILPEKGFELRDEQIFMAYQLERAYKEKTSILAEAGVGTGKTIVYLLYAICYARYTGKPAIIACADESLIEQLVKPEGDIAKLERALDLTIDARLAKSDEQYLCLNKLESVMGNPATQNSQFKEVYQSVPKFAFSNATLQSFEAYGDRRLYHSLEDENWEQINWDVFQDCSLCKKRHRCGKTLTREFTRKAADLIICSHDYFMQHVWTEESRKREGQLPLLPEYSSVVFDEGHLLEFAAQKALTYTIKNQMINEIFERLLQNDIREQFALLIEDFLYEFNVFFDQLDEDSVEVDGSNRMTITKSTQLTSLAEKLSKLANKVGDELVFESETYTLEDYETKIVDEHLDGLLHSLHLFINENDAIIWTEKENNELSLVIMPRTVQEVMREKVFNKKVPYIFSSATLSENGSFEYISNNIGLSSYLSFTVQSPFNYEDNMKVMIPTIEDDDKMQVIFEKITETAGRALILCNTKDEVQQVKRFLQTVDLDYPCYFEGDKEITTLIEAFQTKEESILVARTLWEGLDIPGNALQNVIIFSLPFPPNDPVFDAKRKNTSNPFTEVELPYMLLRLRQGIGRLIRSEKDRGIITILDEKLIKDQDVFRAIKSILPEGVEVK
jgi:ATP-dependent DNA helicase DinG